MTGLLDRVQIVPAPPALPGKCALCGTSQGPMVDIGMDLEFYGAVYFCVEYCFVSIANAFDYKSPSQWKVLADVNKAQQEELESLREQNDHLRDALHTVSSLAGMPTINRVPELDVDALSQKVDSGPEQLSFDFTAGEAGSSESVDEPGPTDLWGDDSNDAGKFDLLGDWLDGK